MTDRLPVPEDRLAPMRASTPARIFLPPAGASIATTANLDFQLAHAQARDAVNDRLEVGDLADRLRARGLAPVCARSAAANRRAFLMRPDLGRRLDEAARKDVGSLSGDYDLVFVIADGLSARAVSAHAVPLLEAALPAFQTNGWRSGPVVIVEQGRVAIGDEIGELLGTAVVAVLIGERPGLSSPDSLGVYLTYAPRVGKTDAERNCLSNIHLQGTSYEEAARRLAYLAREARRRKMTGVDLKDESGPTLAGNEIGVLPPGG